MNYIENYQVHVQFDNISHLLIIDCLGYKLLYIIYT